METQEMTVIEAAENAGVSKSKAEAIKKTFLPMSDMVLDFESAYKKIVKVKKITPELCSDARVLRLKIVKIRTGTEKLRKQQKDEYVRAGKAIDGVANVLKWAVKDKEDHLEEIEKHFERLEAERREKIKDERESELREFKVDGSAFDLGNMDQVVWENYISGVKLNHADKIKEQKKAQEEKEAAIAKGKAEAVKKAKEEKERQRKLKVENARLWKEAEEKAEEQRKLDAEKQKELDKIKAENDKNAKIAQDALDELNRKNEQEEAERARIIAEKKKAEQAPDIDKLKFFSNQIQGLIGPDVKSKELKEVVLEAEIFLNNAITVLIKAIES